MMIDPEVQDYGDGDWKNYKEPPLDGRLIDVWIQWVDRFGRPAGPGTIIKNAWHEPGPYGGRWTVAQYLLNEEGQFEPVEASCEGWRDDWPNLRVVLWRERPCP